MHELLNRIKDNPKKIAYMAFLDLALITSVLVLGIMFSSIFPENVEEYMQQSKINAIFGLSASITYIIVILLAYSAAKTVQLKLIASLFEKTEISLDSSLRMFSLSLILLIIMFIIFMLIVLLSTISANADAVVTLSAILLAIYAFFAVAFVNIIHSLFLTRRKGLLKSALIFTFTRIPRYAKVYLYDIILLAIIMIAVSAVWILFSYAMPSAALSLTQAASLLLLLIFLSFNRILFYMAVRR